MRLSGRMGLRGRLRIPGCPKKGCILLFRVRPSSGITVHILCDYALITDVGI